MKGNRILKKMKYDIVLFYHVSYRLNSFFLIYAPDLPNNRQTNRQTDKQTEAQGLRPCQTGTGSPVMIGPFGFVHWAWGRYDMRKMTRMNLLI